MRAHIIGSLDLQAPQHRQPLFGAHLAMARGMAARRAVLTAARSSWPVLHRSAKTSRKMASPSSAKAPQGGNLAKQFPPFQLEFGQSLRHGLSSRRHTLASCVKRGTAQAPTSPSRTPRGGGPRPIKSVLCYCLARLRRERTKKTPASAIGILIAGSGTPLPVNSKSRLSRPIYVWPAE